MAMFPSGGLGHYEEWFFLQRHFKISHISEVSMKIFLLTLTLCVPALAVDYGYLKKEDQKYFQNDIMEGNNQRERIDLNVIQINKLMGEMESMKADIQKLKSEVEMLKAKK